MTAATWTKVLGSDIRVIAIDIVGPIRFMKSCCRLVRLHQDEKAYKLYIKLYKLILEVC